MTMSAPESGEGSAGILVVDDHPPNLLAAEAVLEPLGLPIVTATSGAQALAMTLVRDFVMIVMDVYMTELDGFQTTERLRKHDRAREVPVVFLTAGAATAEEIMRGYALGAVDFITKPYDPHVLRAKVRALVSLYTLAQRIERERSRQLERIKDLFLGAVGHDLRTPLNAIVMAQRLTMATECTQPAHHQHALRTERAAQRMGRMIEDILDLTRGQFAEGFPLSVQTTNLGEISRAVVTELRMAYPDRPLELAVVGDVVGLWDGNRLGRVLTNLVANAMQHSTQGPVTMRLDGSADDVVIRVHNLGPPIPDALLPTLFEPFRRDTARSDGLGLGLYIVGAIVQAHRGTVTVSSTESDGTTFAVRLPRNGAPL